MITLNAEIADALCHGATLVVPTRQRAHAVRLAFARHALARGCAVWGTPDVLAAEAWVAREIERAATHDATLPRVLTPAQDWWLWRACTLAATRDTDVVAGAALAEALRRAGHLASGYDIDLAPWCALGGRETQLLEWVRRAVRDARADAGVDTATDLALRLPQVGGERIVHFAGFTSLDPPLWRTLHQRRHALGLGGQWWPVRAAVSEPRVDRAGDAIDEIERTAGWCLQRLEASADARLMVVAAGAAARRERLATQIRAALAPAATLSGDDADDLVAIDGGAPLNHQALVRHLLAGLAWLVEGLEFSAFSAWLTSPFGALDAASAARLDLWWRRSAPLEADARASLARLARAAHEGLEPAARLAECTRAALDALGDGAAGARAWSERFSGAVLALRSTQLVYSSGEQQTWQRFVALLDEFGSVGTLAGRLDARQALRALRELAQRTSYQPATGDALVTIVPGHDDPIVSYDAIRVIGLTADDWPAAAVADPFIPLPALREAGVLAATSAGQLLRAGNSLAAWRAASRDLTLSSPTRGDDMEVSPSPLLADWPRCDPLGIRTTRWLPLRLQRPIALVACDDARGRPWPAHRPLPRGTRSLQLQSECPFRAYAELQLGAEPLEEPAPGVARDERGRWLHRALELFWREVEDSTRLAALDPESLQALVRRVVDAARDSALVSGRDTSQAARDREAGRLAQIISEFADLERTRVPFSVRALEQRHELALGGAQLALRLDRIDALAGGGLAVIDYKSGQPKRLEWSGERPAPAQLMAYLASLGDEVRALANAHVCRPRLAYCGMTAQEGLLPRVPAVTPQPGETAAAAWARRSRQWRDELAQLAAAFLRADAEVLPAKLACRHCHLASLCRVGERAQLDSDDGVAPEAADD